MAWKISVMTYPRSILQILRWVSTGWNGLFSANFGKYRRTPLDISTICRSCLPDSVTSVQRKSDRVSTSTVFHVLDFTFTTAPPPTQKWLFYFNSYLDFLILLVNMSGRRSRSRETNILKWYSSRWGPENKIQNIAMKMSWIFMDVIIIRLVVNETKIFSWKGWRLRNDETYSRENIPIFYSISWKGNNGKNCPLPHLFTFQMGYCIWKVQKCSTRRN